MSREVGVVLCFDSSQSPVKMVAAPSLENTSIPVPNHLDRLSNTPKCATRDSISEDITLHADRSLSWFCPIMSRLARNLQAGMPDL